MMASSVVETVADWAERGAVAFTILAAASGLIFVVASRQVKRLEAIRAEARDERSAKLELDLAQQRERTAKAEKSLLELQEDAALRGFNKEEFHTLVRLLTRDPKGHVDIVHKGGPEAEGFADWFAAALQVSGWTFSVSETALLPGPHVSNHGVGIAIRDGERPPARLKTLHDALIGAGITTNSALVYLDPKLPEDAIQLSVWPKPVTERARW